MAFASKTENNTRPDPRIPHLHNLHLNNPLIPNIIQRADCPSLHINIKPKTEKEKTKGRRSGENNNNKRKKREDWPDIRVPIHRSCLGGEHTTEPRITIQVRRTLYVLPHQIVHTLTVSQRSGQPGPDTQKHHQLYRDRRATEPARTLSHRNGDTNTIVIYHREP